MVVPQITARVRRLHDELLALDRPAREGQLVAGATPARLVAPGHVHRRPAVAVRLVDGPRAVVGAHEGAAAIVAAGLGVATVVERPVALVAGAHGRRRIALLGPAARRLAAVPVPGRLAVARRALGGRLEEEGQQRKEGGKGETHRV